MSEFEAEVLDSFVEGFSKMRSVAERALAQVPEDCFRRVNTEQSNSILTIMKHMAGNMKSRWTDFLTSDGEKDDRNRDEEFVSTNDSLESIRLAWDSSWEILENTLSSLKASDLQKQVKIRGEGHSVYQALLRQTSHYRYHIGQIVYISREYAGEQWQSLSIAKGQSQQFNANPDKYLGDDK